MDPNLSSRGFHAPFWSPLALRTCRRSTHIYKMRGEKWPRCVCPCPEISTFLFQQISSLLVYSHTQPIYRFLQLTALPILFSWFARAQCGDSTWSSCAEHSLAWCSPFFWAIYPLEHPDRPSSAHPSPGQLVISLCCYSAYDTLLAFSVN